MADPQNRPDEGAEATPPAKKAAAKKAPAKKAPVKKVPAAKGPAKKASAQNVAAKKAPAKKAPAKKAAPPPPPPALKAGPEAPALTPTAPHAALTAGKNGAREAAAGAKSSVHAVAPRPQESFGRGHRIPLSLGLAAAGLVAIALSRFRRG